MHKFLLFKTLFLVMACTNGWCAHLDQTARVELQWRRPNCNGYNALLDTPRYQKQLIPKLDSAQLEVQRAAQSRRLGWYAVGTAVAGLGSGVVFVLMPLLLLPVAGLLGLSAIKKGKQFRKTKLKNGYKLGWLGLVLSAVFLAIVGVLLSST